MKISLRYIVSWLEICVWSMSNKMNRQGFPIRLHGTHITNLLSDHFFFSFGWLRFIFMVIFLQTLSMDGMIAPHGQKIIIIFDISSLKPRFSGSKGEKC